MSSSSFFKSSGTSVTLQNTVDQLVTDAETAKTAAETAATNAASSAGLSSTYANNSNTSATNAAASLTSAQSAQSAAETAETNAETAQTAAETAETNAASSASTASTQASNASTSATAAASSASTASTKASEASTSATNAATSETNAATSATNAASSATTASGHASTASTQASNASTSATNAASSASAASTSETNAATSESNASTSETNAATSASTASTQATNAANSATAAATSATNAASSATSAASSASTAQSLSDSFNNIYLGALSSAPTQDPDGSALDEGDLYYDTTQGELKVYKSSGWAAAGSTVNGTSARFHYDITATTGTLSGSDANGNTLAYDAGYVDVFVNGVRMSNADVTTTSGNSIVFTEDLVNGDDVDIVAYGTFVITQLNADNLDSGTVPDARITGAYTGITNLTMSGNLTVDTNTLYVDSANNRVGVGTVSPAFKSQVESPVALSGSGNDYYFAVGNSSNNSRRSVALGVDGVFGNAVIAGYNNFNPGLGSLLIDGTDIQARTNGTERMRIDSSGRLLIGNTDGSYASANADNIVIGDRTSSSESGITFGSTVASSLRFADSGTTQQGMIQYVHNDTITTDYMNFYTAATERMRIDSSGNVGIGIVPQSYSKLQVKASTDRNVAIFDNAAGATIGGLTDAGASTTLRLAGSALVMTGGGGSGSEHMRIDSSGNLLVGKTNTLFSNAGVRILPTGNIYPVANGSAPLEINRLSSDGDIVKFYKDSSTVGVINSSAGVYISMGSGDTGFSFNPAVDGLLPHNPTTNAQRDAAIDLGFSTVRWKDLYLSGGVYLGGTGSANYLDDYEEGDWDPEITRATTGIVTTYEYQRGYYIKVGALVTLFINIKTDTVSNTGSGSVVITNLPFATTSDVGFRASGSIAYQDMFGTSTVENLRLNMPESSSVIYLVVQDLDSITKDTNLVANPLSNRFMQASITYKTDS